MMKRFLCYVSSIFDSLISYSPRVILKRVRVTCSNTLGSQPCHCPRALQLEILGYDLRARV